METRKLQQLSRKQYEEYFKVRPGHIAHELNCIRKEMNLINTQPLD